MTSGANWARRRGSNPPRLCARAGCSARAAATLRFQPTLRQAWLVDLDETAARTQGDLCDRHAAALVLPRGWELYDERTDGGSPRPAEPSAERASEPSLPNTRLRRRAPGGGNASEPGRAPSQLPDFEPVVVASNGVPAQFGANDADDVDDDALDAVLDARTPLLRRAFRNAKPSE